MDTRRGNDGEGAPERVTLEADYRAATYRVGKLALVVGEPAPGLDLLLEARGLSEWALLTAWNPKSVERPEEENRLAQGRLVGKLDGYQILAGRSEAPDGSWGEPQVLVLGIPRWEALELAREAGQAAMLAGTLRGPVELVWVDR